MYFPHIARFSDLVTFAGLNVGIKWTELLWSRVLPDLQVLYWMKVFGRDNVMVVHSDDLQVRPKETLKVSG